MLFASQARLTTRELVLETRKLLGAAGRRCGTPTVYAHAPVPCAVRAATRNEYVPVIASEFTRKDVAVDPVFGVRVLHEPLVEPDAPDEDWIV